MSEPRKRKWGDRRDGYWEKNIPGLNTIMMHLFPNRTDCEVYLSDKLDVTEVMKFLAKKNEGHPDYKTTIFHAMIIAVARMIKERPYMNRFVQGRRLYERKEISLSFVAKRRFIDGSDEAIMFFVPKDDDNLDTLSYRMAGEIRQMRKSEHSTGGIDKTIDGFAKIPRLILMFVLRVIRWLDFWGVNPKALTDGDCNYSSVLLSNLGSIGGPAVYHHLNNYGTNSIMVTVGTVHKEEIVMPDGHKEVRDILDFGATIDERIADGFYYVRSLKLLKYIFANPELLDRPMGEHSGFSYE
ncbi:MAG: 2-oxo acid dehydrogenase subunit E2 [Bacteroidales bacterium]|nr:2-oxo acid dehydrogenase subunit E2 [Bacteroidales bacterium]